MSIVELPPLIQILHTTVSDEDIMARGEDSSSVQVLYQLSWDGKLEHPHMIEVHYPPNQGGLRLRDVKKRLTTLRGHGINDSFSWSSKRNYKNEFIWNDLCDDDVIQPLRGSGEYVLRASELFDTFTNKPWEHPSKHSNERMQSSRTMSVDNVTLQQGLINVKLHSGALAREDDQPSGEKLCCSGRRSCINLEDCSSKGVAIDIPKNLQNLSVDQETIDVEKSDFCLSSSDNEVSPRLKTAADCITPVKDVGLVVMTRSTTVHGLHTPAPRSLTSPTEPPFSPGSAKRMWKKEIRKSLFRTSRNSSNVNPVLSGENAALDVDVPPITLSTQEDVSFWRDGRSKSASPSSLNELREVQNEKEKEAEQSTSQLIRLLWARWTGGSSKGKRTPQSTCEDPLPKSPEAKQMPRSRTKTPCKEIRSTNHIAGSLPVTCPSPAVDNKAHSSLDRQEIPPQEECKNRPSPMTLQSCEEITSPVTEIEQDVEIGDIKAIVEEQASNKFPEPEFQQNLRTEQIVLSVQIPDLHIDALDSPTSDTQGSPAEADIPKSATARVKTSNSLPRVKTTTSPKPLPPGFHKGTNDTKPVQIITPRRTPRTSIPLASPPPLVRTFNRVSVRSLSSIAAITLSPENDSAASNLSPENPIVKKRINFRERDEMPLIPGLTTLDWEKALQEAVTDCLPPPNFREILQECSTCGRTFKPDSLQVHMRGCHPPQYARAFSARASPHVVRSRAS